MEHYYEKIKSLDQYPALSVMAELCAGAQEACLYEIGDEITIGLGVHTEICVSAREIVVTCAGESNRVKVQALCEDLEKVLSEIALRDWRMYGIVNFSLARYIYGLDGGDEDQTLFHFLIPETEYRICGKEVRLRSVTQAGVEALEQKLEQALNQKADETQQTFLDAEAVIGYDADYYKKIVSAGVAEIQNGEYQKVILSRKVPLHARLDMKQTYLSGRQANTPARSYWYRMRGFEVVGFSPETVAEVDNKGTVYTFPLAGTRALTEDKNLNKALKQELLHDTKEIAEHAVSVKLAEEELQQVCKPGSVVVTEFMSVMERGTVQHLGSRLRGKLRADLNRWHALCKLFPAVTASGIPKREAIDAIGRIEQEPRGLYSGGVMICDSDGALDAALVLRSVFQTPEESWARVGAGIVDMSKPEREFTETQEKVSCIARNLVAAKS